MLSEAFWRMRKYIVQRQRRRQGLFTLEQTVAKVHGRSGVYFVMSWTILGCSLAYFLFCWKDPQTGETILVDPKNARMFSMGISREFQVTKFDEAKKQWVKTTVNPTSIDDD